MEFVKCRNCGSEGYTASPFFAKCRCGESFKCLNNKHIGADQSLFSASFKEENEFCGKQNS